MLKDKIVREIRANGPMRVDQFMSRALFDAKEGYYTTKHVFGRKGDFITSPEICQVFGEMIAVLAASTMASWREQQPDKNIQLVELGPGRGTLMHDMLRTMQYMPEIARPNAVKMIEASENLQDQQQHILKPFTPEENVEYITWHDTLDVMEEKPSIIVANEFFDALPTRQFIKRGNRWMERVIGEEKGALVWQDGAIESLPATYEFLNTASEDAIYEYSSESAEVMTQLAKHLATNSGMAIIIDYGYTAHALGDSLQALKKHEYANVLEDIGEVDITAHVNFAMLKDIAEAEGLRVHTLITQGKFLQKLGAELRLSALCQNAEPAQIIDLIKGLERLMSPDQMGLLFKVLVVASSDVPVVHQFA